MATFPTARTAYFGNPPTTAHQPNRRDIIDVLEQLELIASVEVVKGFHAAVGGLPSAGNEEGDYRVVLAPADDDGGVYEWDGSEWELVAALPVYLTESISAQEAAASATAAAESATEADQSASSAASSANLAGVVLITKTKAEADAALAGLDEGDIVEVSVDETRDDVVARYRVTSGAFEFLVGFTREPTTDDVLNESDVPGVSLTQALDAAVDRENHTGTQEASTITGLADVATSGDFDDLDNVPTLDTETWEGGTSEDEALISPADVAAAFEAHEQQVGVGQTWQDVSGSRSTGTSYQNTTGKPIQLAVRTTGSSSGRLEVSSDGSTWLRIGSAQQNSAGQNNHPLVPDGWYYRLDAGAVEDWMELR